MRLALILVSGGRKGQRRLLLAIRNLLKSTVFRLMGLCNTKNLKIVLKYSQIEE